MLLCFSVLAEGKKQRDGCLEGCHTQIDGEGFARKKIIVFRFSGGRSADAVAFLLSFFAGWIIVIVPGITTAYIQARLIPCLWRGRINYPASHLSIWPYCWDYLLCVYAPPYPELAYCTWLNILGFIYFTLHIQSLCGHFLDYCGSRMA